MHGLPSRGLTTHGVPTPGLAGDGPGAQGLPVRGQPPAASWIDSHCHLDAAEFTPDRAAVLARARAAGVSMQVLPAVDLASAAAVRALAHVHGLAYGIGLHPLYVAGQPADVIARLDALLDEQRADPHLVAVGEIGIDGFVPGLDLALQERRHAEQLALAVNHRLPVILHVRRSADRLLAALRRQARSGRPVAGGIAHAFNGSAQQARAFVDLGFKLGFGGALCYERALQIRRLAAELPAEALVLETDAPDIPPPWRYTDAARRAAGEPQGRNEPAELPRIGAELARLRGLDAGELAALTTRNTLAALPRLAPLWAACAGAGPTPSNGQGPEPPMPIDTPDPADADAATGQAPRPHQAAPA